MKNIGLILAILLTLGFVYLFSLNNSLVSVNLFEHAFSLKLSIYAFIAFVTGVFVGMFLMLRTVFVAGDNYKKLKRQYEKTSVGADDSDLKVRTLENKIKTLEVALKKALESKD